MSTLHRTAAFKPLFAVLGLCLLSAPLLWNVSFEQRVNVAKNANEIVHSMYGVTGGILTGSVGILVLGLVIDCGSGYRRRWLHLSMLLLGVCWLFIHPAGYLIGIVLLLDSLYKLFAGEKRNRTA